MSYNTRNTRQNTGLVGRPQVTYHQSPRPQQQQQQTFVNPTYQVQQQQQQQQQQQSPQQGTYQQQAQMYKMHQQQQQPATPQMKSEPKSPPRPLLQGQTSQPNQTLQATQGALGSQSAQTSQDKVGQQPLSGQSSVQESFGETSETSSKPWKKHKNIGFKVNKVQKRRRQNARFRKLLIPKNAIMVLNELQPGILFDSEEHTNAFNQQAYTVKLEIDGHTYTGEGPSKAAAKSAAAELAVKGLILNKIAESNIKKDGSESEETMETDLGDDASDKGSQNGSRPAIPEDEVPWGSLASFALFKLFADWKAQGNNIPQMASAIIKQPKQARSHPLAKPVMPEHPESIHPVTLVGRLHPGTIFSELSREGNPPSMTFTMSVTINGEQYTGTAKSKKEAKKQAAIAALKALGIPYDMTA